MKSYRTIQLFEEAVQNDCVMLTRVHVYHGIKLTGKEFESDIHMARVHYHTVDSTKYAYVTINGHDDERQFFKFIDKLNTFIVPPVELEFE